MRSRPQRAGRQEGADNRHTQTVDEGKVRRLAGTAVTRLQCAPAAHLPGRSTCTAGGAKCHQRCATPCIIRPHCQHALPPSGSSTNVREGSKLRGGSRWRQAQAAKSRVLCYVLGAAGAAPPCRCCCRQLLPLLPEAQAVWV